MSGSSLNWIGVEAKPEHEVIVLLKRFVTWSRRRSSSPSPRPSTQKGSMPTLRSMTYGSGADVFRLPLGRNRRRQQVIDRQLPQVLTGVIFATRTHSCVP